MCQSCFRLWTADQMTLEEPHNAWRLTVNHGDEGQKGTEMVKEEQWGSCPLGSSKNNVRFVQLNFRELAALSILSAALLFPCVHCPLLLTSISACAKFIRLPSVCAAHNGSPILLALKRSAKRPGLTQQWVFSVSGVGRLLARLNTPQSFRWKSHSLSFDAHWRFIVDDSRSNLCYWMKMNDD